VRGCALLCVVCLRVCGCVRWARSLLAGQARGGVGGHVMGTLNGPTLHVVRAAPERNP
jgi:hypothetical protein